MAYYSKEEFRAWMEECAAEVRAVKLETPRMKRLIAVVWENGSQRKIHLDTSPGWARMLEGFGDVYSFGPNHYGLTVDGRYDFDEVLAYIKAWGQP